MILLQLTFSDLLVFNDMNWGWKISIFMGIYMAGILGVVWFAMTQDVNLVTEDYYKHELAYEEQITRLKNTNTLKEKPTFALSSNRKVIVLSFPEGLVPKGGKILLYRPSDFTQDRKFKLDLDENQQQGFISESFLPGLWKAKLTWEDKDNSYFQEFVIVI